MTSHLRVVPLSPRSHQRFLQGWSFRRRGRLATPLCERSPSRSVSRRPSRSSTGRGNGATCLQGGRTPTALEEGGRVGGGAARDQARCCWGAEGLESRMGAGRSGREEWACWLAVAGAPSLVGC